MAAMGLPPARTSEDSMKAFIHDHFSGILQPFADRLEALNDAMTEANANIANTGSKGEDNSKSLEKLKADLESTMLQVDSIQCRQDSKYRELSAGKVAVAKDLLEQSKEVSMVSSRLDHLQKILQELRQGFQDSSNAATQLQSDFKEVAQKVNGFDFSSVDRMQLELFALARQQESTQSLLKATAHCREKDHDDLHSLMEACKQEEHKNEGRSKAINNSIVNLGRRIDQTNQVLSNLQPEKIVLAYEEIAAMQKQIKNMLKMLTNQETRLLETSGVKDSLRASIADLKSAVGTDGEGFNTELGLYHALRQIQDVVDLNTKAVRAMGLTCEKQAQEYQNESRRLAALERVEPNLQVMTRELEAQLTARLDRLEEKFKQHDRYNDQMMAMNSTARDFDMQAHVDVQNQETSQMKRMLSRMGNSVDSNSNRMQALENKMSVLQDTVGSLRGGLDLTHEYWKGLTKGVQRTHRSVVTEEDLFHSKTALNKPLPAITPRDSAQA